jgi:hypothetical protein
VLPFAVLTLGLYLVLHTIGGLLNEIQLTSDSSFGGLGTVASGYSPGVIDRTQSLLATWASASQDRRSHDLIAWTARAYTAMEYLFLIAYALVLIALWRRVRMHLTPGSGGDPTSRDRLRRAAYWRRGWMFAVGAALADAIQNSIRFYLIEETVARNPVPDWVIGLGWAFTLIKVVLIAVSLILTLVLLYDTGQLTVWLRRTGRSLWRLRVAVVAIALYSLLLLEDPTGQVVDLTRRWVTDGVSLVAALFVLLSSLLLGLCIWLYARRVVLADHPQNPTNVRWTPTLLGFAVVTAALGYFFGWGDIYAFATIALIVLVAGWLLFRTPITGGTTQAEAAEHAYHARRRDAGRPPEEEVVAVRRATRALAILAPLTVLLLTAVAYSPVMIVLPLSHQEKTRVFAFAVALVVVAVLGAPLAALGGCALLRAWDGQVNDEPDQLERRYVAGGIASVVVLGISITGAVLHWSVVTAILVIAAFLSAVMLALGEAQRWSETHTAPPGLLGIGFTRLPVATLLIAGLLVATFVLDTGSEHDVHRQGTLPSGLSAADGRTGVSLSNAFDQWVEANCAGAGHTGAVPMYLIAAPGGGIRAAYWTASTLTELFGADRTVAVPDCPGAAKADRIFAMGGASGGSLGVLSYEAGLTGQRTANWYEAQLGSPDFLTDPLSWMLTTDLARAFIGFGGEDRARRLEDNFSRNITGLGQDFFAGTWGLGGRSPLMLLTGTQVESGCRLNVSGLRLTNVDSRADGVGCAGLGQGADQSNAARTTDLLDVVCNAVGKDPQSISRATAALLSARFPYVSPSGQMYYCVDKPTEQNSSTAIVDGGYAENTGIGMLLSLWPRLDALITAHNEEGGNASIVPVFIDVSNDYAQVASPTQRGRTVEGLVPPVTQGRPAQLNGRAEEQTAAAIFTGPVPGQNAPCDLATGAGRFLVISPLTSPGLPAPLAWTLSQVAVDDLNAQRGTAIARPGPTAAQSWAGGPVTCAS